MYLRPFRWFFPIALFWCLLAPNVLLFGQNETSRLQTLNNKIELFAEHENEDSFLVYTKQKLLLTRKLDRLGDWLETYVDLQDFYSHDHSKALQYLEEALQKKWREPKNPDEWEQFLYLYTFQGYHLSQLSRIWPAVQAYESARTLYEKHRFADYKTVQWLYKPLGNHYTRLGDNEKALAVFQKALLQQNTPDELAGLYVNISLAYWNSGQIQPAQTHCEKGLALQGVSSSKRAMLLGTLSLINLETGSLKEAVDLSEQALSLLGTPGAADLRLFEDRARIRRTAGLAYTRLGRYKDAQRLLDGALSDARRVWGNGLSRDIGKIELAVAEWHLVQNQPQQAVKAANRALSSVLPGFKPKTDFENPRPDELYEENTLFEALLCKAEAGSLMSYNDTDSHFLAMALECHNLAYLAEMRLRAVYQYESSKLELQTSSRKREEAAMEIVRRLYMVNAGSPIDLKKGLEIAERCKATLLMEALQENLVRQHQNDPELLQTLVSLRRMAAWYNKQRILEHNSPNADQWRIELDVVQEEINACKKRIPGIDLYESAVNLSTQAANVFGFKDEVVLEYFVCEKVTDVFTCNENGAVDWKWVEHDEALLQNLIRFRAYFSDGNAILNDPEGYLETAYLLWNKLLPQGFCGTAPRLVIVPDGYLHYVPFEALVSAKPDDNANLRNAAYVVKKQQIRYAWSIQSMRTQDALLSQAKNAVLGVAPGFAGNERGLAPLSPGKKEWATLGFGAVHALSDNEATLDRFLEEAAKHRVLHLSTHAFAGDMPRIELYDQSMLLSDVYALPLQADLVVLSACETGMGENVKGEGVMSLARAFAHAGAACVVSSLWPVNDQTTARLMGGFYRHLKSGQTIGTALRQAKLDYLNDPEVPAVRQSPFFWAGMVEVGSDRVIDVPNSMLVWLLAVGATVMLGFLGLMMYLLKKKKTNSP